ncbi:Histone-lysine N-methyltransferase EHMT1-like isoform X4 [Aphelenchoides fujianensis]|nr:Histone-lysine N-methyltransferase EHMT1-like isoform X4 [Aphelenchoides fujianensis]
MNGRAFDQADEVVICEQEELITQLFTPLSSISNRDVCRRSLPQPQQSTAEKPLQSRKQAARAPTVVPHTKRMKCVKMQWNPQSEPAAFRLPPRVDEQPALVKYRWKPTTEHFNPGGISLEKCGCECAKYKIDCRAGFCVCSVGNVALTKDGRIAHPQTLNFYYANYAECTDECACSGRCGLRLSTSRPQHELVVRSSPTAAKGFGVFATQKIRAGSFVCEMSGELLPRKMSTLFDPSNFIYCFKLKDPTARTPTNSRRDAVCYDAREKGNESRFFNHSCAPSLGILQSCNHWAGHRPVRVFFYAFRDIRAGDELTFNYGREWLQGRQVADERFTCLCGAAGCQLPRVGRLIPRPLPKPRAKRPAAPAIEIINIDVDEDAIFEEEEDEDYVHRLRYGV